MAYSLLLFTFIWLLWILYLQLSMMSSTLPEFTPKLFGVCASTGGVSSARILSVTDTQQDCSCTHIYADLVYLGLTT